MRPESLEAASTAFYGALARLIAGDPSAMDGLWAQDDTVIAMHPLGGRVVGWPAVRASWEQVAGLRGTSAIELHDPAYLVAGELGIVTGFEAGPVDMDGRHYDYSGARATNIFKLVDGTWKVVVHHTDAAPGLVAFLRGAPAAVAAG